MQKKEITKMADSKSVMTNGNLTRGADVQFLSSIENIGSATDLKTVLSSVEEGLRSMDIPPVYALMLLNGVLHRRDIYEIMNDENRAIGARIWGCLRTSGIQLELPPILGDNPDPRK